jgi:hypothetical protein
MNTSTTKIQRPVSSRGGEGNGPKVTEGVAAGVPETGTGLAAGLGFRGDGAASGSSPPWSTAIASVTSTRNPRRPEVTSPGFAGLDGDRSGPGPGVTVGPGAGTGVTVRVGEGDTEADGDGPSEGLGVGVSPGEGVSDGDGDGFTPSLASPAKATPPRRADKATIRATMNCFFISPTGASDDFGALSSQHPRRDRYRNPTCR